MSKPKSIRDNKQVAQPASNGVTPDSSKRIALTSDNAPIFSAKFLEEIRDELRKLNEALQDMIANQRDV